MQIPDLINGSYEMLGGLVIAMSIRKLAKEKIVRGVHWVHAGFFASWGWWNLYYYPHLDQWASFVGGVFIVTANSIWLGQFVYYTRKEKQEEVMKDIRATYVEDFIKLTQLKKEEGTSDG